MSFIYHAFVLSQYTQHATPKGWHVVTGKGASAPFEPPERKKMARYSRRSAGKRTKILRHHSVRVFLSDTEHEALRRRAGKMALSRYLRETGLGECKTKIMKNEEIRSLIQQFARLGNNLNQIARVFNVARLEGRAIYIVRFLAGMTSIEREISDVVQNFFSRKRKGHRD